MIINAAQQYKASLLNVEIKRGFILLSIIRKGGIYTVTLKRIGNSPNIPFLEIVGLSKDEKPTVKIENVFIVNGSTFKEIDTGDIYIYDEESESWVLDQLYSNSKAEDDFTLSEITPEEVEALFKNADGSKNNEMIALFKQVLDKE